MNYDAPVSSNASDISTIVADQPAHRELAPFWGTLYGAISAVSYTAANVCLRSVTDCDPVWVSFMKAIPTAAGIAPWLIVRAIRGERVFPPWPVIVTLCAAGVLGQLGGNVVFQWALGVIGIALTVPLCMGAIVIFGAILGRIYLHESVNARTAFALFLLLCAIWLLSIGAQGAYESIKHVEAGHRWLVLGAVLAACLSGFSYAVLGVTIRRAVMGEATVSATTFCIALVGVLCLGTLTFARLDANELWETTSTQLYAMLLAGVFNLIAFVALTRALQVATLVYVNALNASQVAMASVVGVVLFSEQPSPALTLGVSATVLGLLLLPRQKKTEAFPEV